MPIQVPRFADGGLAMAFHRVWQTLIASMCVGILTVLPSGAVINPVAEVAAAPGESTLAIGLLGTISTLNPFIAYFENDIFFSSLIYDSLVTFDQDLNPIPNLAESCHAVPDALPYGSVWQYNLTHNAEWHDGEPMTADDVVFTIAYQTGVNFATMWSNQPYTLWIDHATLIDSYTVRIHFRNMSGDPSPCAFGDRLIIPIVPKHIWENISPAEASFSYVNSHPIGTGPFMATSSTYTEFTGGVNITLLRNPSYHWAAEYGKQVHFDKLDLRFYANDTTLSAALQSGEIDVARLNNSGYSQLDAGIRSGSITNMTTMTGLRPDGYFTDLAVNMNPAGSNLARLDPWVRVALAMATNRTGIVDSVYGGYAMEGSTLVSPVYPYWHLSLGPGDVFPYDPVAAAILLLLAGYSDTDSDGVLEAGPDSLAVQNGWEPEGTQLTFDLLVVHDRPLDRMAAMALQEAYIAIGVELVIVLVDLSLFMTVVYAYNYDMAINYWDQAPDPSRILFVESTYALAGWSDNAYSNPEYNENYTASLNELDPVTRQTYVQNCQVINYVEAPYIVLAYLNQTYVRRTDTFTGWGNWTDHPGRSLDARWGANPLFFDLIPNTIPTASFTITPTAGDTTTSFDFNASASLDSEDPVASLEVRWDWESDGTWDTDWTTTKIELHIFATAGNYSIKLIVRDTLGLTNTTTQELEVVEFQIPEFGTMPLMIVLIAMVAVVAARSASGRRRTE